MGAATGAFASDASEDFLEYKPFSAHLGFGATLAPDTFLVTMSVEGHIDEFFSIGPMAQLGFGNFKEIYIATLGGRYTIPLYALERAKVSFHGGAGMVLRSVRGVHYSDFVFATGFNFDYFVTKGVALGLGYILNVTGDPNERFINSIMGMASYHF